MELIARIAEHRKAHGNRPMASFGGNSRNCHLHRLDLFAGHPRPDFLLSTKAALERRRCHLGEGGHLPWSPLRPAIHPGFTDTPMVRALGQGTTRLKEHSPRHTQLKRLIDPAEIADAIYFMICNSAVSGELWADAGLHARISA